MQEWLSPEEEGESSPAESESLQDYLISPHEGLEYLSIADNLIRNSALDMLRVLTYGEDRFRIYFAVLKKLTTYRTKPYWTLEELRSIFYNIQPQRLQTILHNLRKTGWLEDSYYYDERRRQRKCLRINPYPINILLALETLEKAVDENLFEYGYATIQLAARFERSEDRMATLVDQFIQMMQAIQHKIDIEMENFQSIVQQKAFLDRNYPEQLKKVMAYFSEQIGHAQNSEGFNRMMNAYLSVVESFERLRKNMENRVRISLSVDQNFASLQNMEDYLREQAVTADRLFELFGASIALPPVELPFLDLEQMVIAGRQYLLADQPSHETILPSREEIGEVSADRLIRQLIESEAVEKKRVTERIVALLDEKGAVGPEALIPESEPAEGIIRIAVLHAHQSGPEATQSIVLQNQKAHLTIALDGNGIPKLKAISTGPFKQVSDFILQKGDADVDRS